MSNQKLNISDLLKDTLQDKVMGVFGKSGSGKSTAIKKILNSNVINKNKPMTLFIILPILIVLSVML